MGTGSPRLRGTILGESNQSGKLGLNTRPGGLSSTTNISVQSSNVEASHLTERAFRIERKSNGNFRDISDMLYCLGCYSKKCLLNLEQTWI